MKKPLGAAVCVVFLYTRAFGQDCTFVLEGSVRESNTGPLAYASVRITESGKGVLTDEYGRYRLTGLCRDSTYTLDVSHAACTHQTRSIKLSDNLRLDFELDHGAVLEEIVVRRSAPANRELTQSRVDISGAELEAGKGLGLGESLKRLPGVALLQTGATIAKPVIQGLHSNRIALINHGVVLESQQWGSEHAPEIDPFTAQKITVVKGAAGVRYGAGAMGGAIVLEPEPLRAETGWGGWASGAFYSNNLGGVAAGAADLRFKNKPLAFRLQGTLKRTGNMKTPDYWLGNTGTGEQNAALLGEWKGAKAVHQWGLYAVRQQIGLIRAAHISDTSSLGKALRSPVPLINDDRFTYAVGRPFQDIQHYTLRHKTQWNINEVWKWSGQYGFQFNKRREFDAHPPKGDPLDLEQKPQVSFRLWSSALDLALEHRPIQNWRGGLGANGLFQLNYVSRGGFIPDYQTFGVALWASERYQKEDSPLSFELGGRYDFRTSRVTTTGNAGRNIDTTVVFGNVSGTAGVLWQPATYTHISFNSGYAWRPPHVNELFAAGVHHGAATYERGRRNLKPEKGWNTNLNFTQQKGDFLLSLTLYEHRIRDFIYLNPLNRVVITLRGPFPAYEYGQSELAVLRGADFSADIPLARQWTVLGRAALLRGFRKPAAANETGRKDWLPLMPSDRIQYGIRWKNVRKAKETPLETSVKIIAQTVFEQSRIPAEGLLKAAPPAYTRISLEALRQFTWRSRTAEAGLTVDNLANLQYREYLNFFRYYTDEAGINIGLRLKINF